MDHNSQLAYRLLKELLGDKQEYILAVEIVESLIL
jgi:hypothetical protein